MYVRYADKNLADFATIFAILDSCDGFTMACCKCFALCQQNIWILD